MLDVSKTDLTRVYDLSAKIVGLYRKQLEDKKIDASGQLSRTADFDIDFNDYSLSVYMILESYAWYVENGRNASTGKYGSWKSKYTDIENWIRQKVARGTFVPSSGHTIPRTDKEIKRVAGAIVHKITRVGFYGHDHHGLHPLQDALDEAESLGIIDEIVDLVADGFAGAVETEFEKL